VTTNRGIETLTTGLGDRLPRPQPPDRDRLVPRGSQVCHTEELKHAEPNFRTVDTAKEQVIQSLDLLCTESEDVSVTQPMTSKSTTKECDLTTTEDECELAATSFPPPSAHASNRRR
jgi:hypothetical protein